MIVMTDNSYGAVINKNISIILYYASSQALIMKLSQGSNLIT